MATAGEGRALDPHESYESGYTAPQGQMVSIDIKDGEPSRDSVILHASQQVSFRNLDPQDYRLRLRHGVKGELVGTCIFLEAGKSAEFITDPDACDEHPLAGQYALIEVLLPSQRVFTVYSGPVGGPHGGGPRFELIVVSSVKTETSSPV
jgi:hypothetical protein